MNATIIKVVLLGDSGVGKTSIVQRFIYSSYKEDNPPTIGASFISKLMPIPDTNIHVKFQIWDTAGQEKYKSLASMYYKDAQAAIIVYDITKRNTFESVKNWVSQLQGNADSKIVIAIAGNKADLMEKEEVDVQTAKGLAQSLDAIFKQTSAKDNLGIEELFIELSKRFKQVVPDENRKDRQKVTDKSQQKDKVS